MDDEGGDYEAGEGDEMPTELLVAVMSDSGEDGGDGESDEIDDGKRGSRKGDEKDGRDEDGEKVEGGDDGFWVVVWGFVGI